MRPLDPRLLPHLRPAAATLSVVVAAQVATSLVLVGQMFALAHLVVVVVGGDLPRLPWAIAWVGGAFAVRALLGLLSDVAGARCSATVTTTLRHRLLEAALALPGGEVTGRRTGELTLLLTRGVASVEPYLTRYVPALALACVLPPLTLVAIASQDLLAAAIVLATLPLVPFFAALVGLATRDRADQQWRLLGALAGHFVDVVRGLPTLVVHGRAKAQSRTIRRITNDYRQASLATLRLAFASSAVLELVATLSVALVAVAVGLRLAAGHLDLGTALVVLLLAPEAYWPLRRVGAEFHAAAEGTATFEQATALLGTATPADGAGGVGVGVGVPRVEGVSWGAVQVDDLTVTYPGRTVPALRLDSLRLPRRGLVALAGPSGCGKSTLLAVLAAEVEPVTGEVHAGATALSAATRAGWRRQVSWLPQRPWLEAGTVRDNLLVARPGADTSDLVAALHHSGALDVVNALPDGLETVLDEEGSRLSAGERARVVLARAFLADRPLVLVDEPTAHLDRDSEARLVAALQLLARRSTVLVVTHSAVVTVAAERVVVLERAGDGPAAPATEPFPRPARTDELPPASFPVEALPGTSRRLAVSYALGAMASACGVALVITSGWLITRAAEHPPVLYLMVAIVGVRAFGIGRPLLRYLERVVGHDAALRLLAEERTRVYDAVVPLTPGALGRRRGEVLTHLVDDVDAVLDSRLRVRSPHVAALAVGTIAAAVATVFEPVAGAVLALALGVAYLVSGAVRLLTARAERGLVTRRSMLSASVLQAVQSARDLVLWQASPAAVARVDETGARLAAAARRSAGAVAVGRSAVTAVVGAATVVLAAVTASGTAAGALSGPVAAALVLAPLALSEVLGALPDAAAVAARTRAARTRIQDLVRHSPAVSDPVEPVPLPLSDAGLVVDHVSAGWERPVFSDVGLRLAPGARVGVVGPSGSGKSTLAALLVRFRDPTSGRISLDGVDLRQVSLDDVHRAVTLVDDDPYLFSSTVLENVRLARPAASRDDVEAALRAVALGPWLDDLPEGLDTFLGDGHATVSGGERARIGLARAVLSGAPVVVLDEPTAHLDTGTARAVADDLLHASGDRSLVWISHDGIGLEAMDRVLRLGESSHALVDSRS